MSGSRRPAAVLMTSALLALALASAPASASAGTTTTRAGLIMDDAHVLDVGTVVREVNALHDRSGTRVAVLTTDDPEVGKDTYDDDVMAWLQEHAPDAVLDPGRDGLHPHLLLVAVSPRIRQVGVYAADDVTLDADDVQEVVDAVRPAAEAKSWDEVAVRGAATALSVTARSADSDPTGSDPTGSDPDEDDPDPFPVDPTATGTNGFPAGPVVGGAAGLVAVGFAAVAAVAVRRRRRERRAWLAWEPEPGAGAEALRRWRDAVEQVQVLGYPGQPVDSTAGRVDPANAVETLERLGSSGLTSAQRSSAGERARLRALLDPSAMLAAWVADARYWAREPGWQQRWSREHTELLAAPLTALSRSIDDLAVRLPRADLGAAQQRVGRLTDSAGRLDELVRSEQLRPTDAEAEAARLNGRIRELAQQTADRLAATLSAADRRRLAPGDPGTDPGLQPYLLSGLVMAASHPAASTAWSSGASGSDGSSFSSTTFTDSSGGGSGMTGGSGGF